MPEHVMCLSSSLLAQFRLFWFFFTLGSKLAECFLQHGILAKKMLIFCRCLGRTLLLNDQKLLHCDSLPNSSLFQILNLGKLVCSRQNCDVLKIRFYMKIKLTATL